MYEDEREFEKFLEKGGKIGKYLWNEEYPNGRKVTKCWLDQDGVYHEEVQTWYQWTIKKK